MIDAGKAAAVRGVVDDSAREYRRRDVGAVASLVLGALGCLCGVAGIPGLVVGVMTLRRPDETGEPSGGAAIAIAGVVVSALGIGLWELIAVLWLHYGAHVTIPLVDSLLPRF